MRLAAGWLQKVFNSISYVMHVNIRSIIYWSIVQSYKASTYRNYKKTALVVVVWAQAVLLPLPPSHYQHQVSEQIQSRWFWRTKSVGTECHIGNCITIWYCHYEWKVSTYFKLSTNENFCKNVDLLLLCSDSIIEITGFTSLWNKIIFVHLGSCVCAFQRLYEISQNFQRKILKLPFTSGSISAKNESSVGNA